MDRPAGSDARKVHLGADFDFSSSQKGRLAYGFLFEGGYVGPIVSAGSGSAIFSANYLEAFAGKKSKPSAVLPFLTGGYARLFGTGNAVNFGGGIDLGNNLHAARFEIRDYLQFSDPKKHDIGLRIGFVIHLPG